MCGIVGAAAKRNVVPVLMDGIQRLEYRGYDSAGIAVFQDQVLKRERAQGKVAALKDKVDKQNITGTTGIAHTRWATHGKPSDINAHPHIAGDRVVLVHNGIIENYETLKAKLNITSEMLLSETDTEVVAYYIYEKIIAGKTLLEAILEVTQDLKGTYAICAMDIKNPGQVIGVRKGAPLIVGLSKDENFLASDALALQKVAEEFIYLEDGDVADVSHGQVQLFDKNGQLVERKVHHRVFHQDAADKCGYPHFMLKEIFEQPNVIQDTLNSRLYQHHVLENIFGVESTRIFDQTERVQIVACGTSFHAGLVGRLWLESIVGIPCQVEIASEFRYRARAHQPGTLVVFISQSGETADTLAALRGIQEQESCGILSICNVPDSALVRESSLVFMTNAGPEIGVCSTKAFTTQLIALFLLTMVLGKQKKVEGFKEEEWVRQLKAIPTQIQAILNGINTIETIAKLFIQKSNALFLGRGLQFPIALEGALKLKEISYIHAEAYPAGELKHGPLALVDNEMLVVVVIPNDATVEKLRSNIEEVRARGGELIVFAPPSVKISSEEGIHVLALPEVEGVLAPIVYTVSLQLLAYYVAVLKGTDVDQPRNLAKSVTVE